MGMMMVESVAMLSGWRFANTMKRERINIHRLTEVVD